MALLQASFLKFKVNSHLDNLSILKESFEYPPKKPKWYKKKDSWESLGFQENILNLESWSSSKMHFKD